MDPTKDTLVNGISAVDETTIIQPATVHHPRTPTDWQLLDASPQMQTAEQQVPDHAAWYPRRSAWVVVGHIFAIGILWAAVWALAQGALQTGIGQRVDDAAMVETHQRLSPTLSSGLLQVLDWLPGSAAAAGVIALLILLVRTRRFTTPLVALITATGAIGSVQVLKYFVFTKADLGIHAAQLNSYPSGHTALAAAAGFVVLLAVPNGARPWTGLLMGLVTAVVGCSTLINAWHRPSDVIGAVLVCAGWALLGGMVLYLINGAGWPRELSFAQVLSVGIGLILLMLSAGAAYQAWNIGGIWAMWAGLGSVLGGSLVIHGFVVMVLRHR